MSTSCSASISRQSWLSWSSAKSLEEHCLVGSFLACAHLDGFKTQMSCIDPGVGGRIEEQVRAGTGAKPAEGMGEG